MRSPGFVGRGRELRVLAEAMAAPPVTVLVVGEPGVGKSRLIAEFLATATGAHYLLAGCPPFRQPYTLGPVVDAVRQAVGQVAELGLTRLAGALRPLFPEWTAELPAAPEPVEDPSAARHRLFRALAELIDRLDVRAVVVEDVHWADEATLEFLLFMSARPLSLLLTYRPDDVPADSLLRMLTSRPSADRNHVRLALEPLGVPETAALMSSMLSGGQVSADFAEFVYGRTEGVPLAVEESVRLMADRADLAVRRGEWVRRELSRIGVPPPVRDAVLERVGRLDGDALAVLRASAVLSEAADERTLAAVSGIDAERVVVCLATALGSGLLAEDGRHRISFRHVLAAQAVHDAIPVPLRKQLHLRAGQVLEALTPAPTARLARHFRAAGEDAAWCRYAEQAADTALAAGDHAAAIALLYDVITSGGLPPARLAALADKVPMHSLASEGRYRGLIDTLRSALAAGTVSQADQAQVRFQLARICNNVGDIEASVTESRLAAAILPPGSAESLRVMMYLAWPSDVSTPKSEHLLWLSKVADGSAALPAGKRLRFAVDVTSALLALGEEDGWAEAAKLPELAESVTGLMQLVRASLNVGDQAMCWGRYSQAERALEHGRQLAKDNGFIRVLGEIDVTDAHLRWFRGDWAGLAELADELAVGDHLMPIARGEAVLVRGLLWLAAGDSEQAVRCLDEVLAQARRRGAANVYMEPAAALAGIYLDGDRVADAIAVTDEPTAAVIVKQMWLWGLDLVPVRVRALAAAGRIDEAAGLAAAFDDGLAGIDAPAGPPAVLTARAWLAAAAGDHERAAALFGAASAEWRALPRPHDALLALEAQARHLLAVGKREQGVALLTEAVSGLTVLGAAGDGDRVARVLRVNGVAMPRTWRRGRHGYGSELSPRELDVVRLVVTGKTNREIAAAVHRSPDTVAAQLKSAMRKLGVTTRTALAVRAAEAGLVPEPPASC